MDSKEPKRQFASDDELEEVVAGILGRSIFEFSRLDVALGLGLVWIGGAQYVEELADQVEQLTFDKKLKRFRQVATEGLARNLRLQEKVFAWIDEADQVRVRRNVLVHGRWAVDSRQGVAINVMNLPTSQHQPETRLTVDQLKDHVEQAKRLQKSLWSIREDIRALL